MITKGDIVNGALNWIRISGITVEPNGDDVSISLQILDDCMGELDLDIGYYQPESYGQSLASDDSGLTTNFAGPVKKIVAKSLAVLYGKQGDPSLLQLAAEGERSLERMTVEVAPAQYPETLPMGSGTEWPVLDNHFYNVPVRGDAQRVTFEQVMPINVDWANWLEGRTLASVSYEAEFTLSGETMTDSTSTVVAAFNKLGQHKLCVKATDSAGYTKTNVYYYYVERC